MLPRIFGENLFDDWMNLSFDKDFFNVQNPLYGKHAKNLMKTDIRETESAFELDIDLPGFKKEEIDAKLENGYLTVSASKGLDRDQTDRDGKLIRQERYTGSCARSFYVGDGITEEDISAKYEDGILRLSVPKKEAKKIEQKKSIMIE